MALTKMKHPILKIDTRLYFYSGEAKVVKGVAHIKSDHPEWVQNAWLRGYRIDPETNVERAPKFFLNINAAEESAQSAEEDAVEGTDVGRQPARRNRVRKGEPAGDAGVPESGLDSGDSDGPAVDGEAD